jgi:hypothetical protein
MAILPWVVPSLLINMGGHWSPPIQQHPSGKSYFLDSKTTGKPMDLKHFSY